MTKPILLIPVISVLLGCGMFTQADAPVSRGESPPPVSVSSALTILFHGDSLIEQKILASPIVVRATMTAFSSEVMADADGEFRAVFKFSLGVSEYLKGTGPSAIVALWLDDASYETRGEADVAKAVILARRDDQWDDREAIIFLLEWSSGFGPLVDEQLRLADHFLLYVGDPYSSDDLYSLHSRENKIWLPAATSASSAGDGQKFLLDVPGSGSTTPTITLGELKTRITDVTAELNGGDGSEAYKACVRNKYGFERAARHFREAEGIESYADSPLNRDLMSGLPARTMLAERNWYGVYPDIWAKTWLEGRDGALFSVEQGEATPNDGNNDGVLTAGVDQIRYMESFLTVRPLPAGEYEIDRKEVWDGFIPCNYVLSYSWPVTVTAPAGVLHESFFDPVTVGTAVEADSENGQLAPSSFDNSGVTTTLESLSYEAAVGTGQTGTVKLKLDPHDGLTGHALDFIELDGTVSLSLDVLDATVDSVNKTLSWSVASQPWEDGDQLMLRIRWATSNIPAVAPVILFHGNSSIEEKTLYSATVVRASMTSFSSEVVVVTNGEFSAVMKFNLDVAEYLKGSGPSSIVAVWVDAKSYETRGEADETKAYILARRDDQWDDREAIIFLSGGLSGLGNSLDGQLQLADHFLLAVGDPYSFDDSYSLHSRAYKDWLPAASGTGTAGDAQEFLLDVPGSGSSPPTIMLGSLKTRINEVMAELNGGDGSETYKECVRNKYELEREARYNREVKGNEFYTDSNLNRDLVSGLPARTLLAERNWYGVYPDIKGRTWLEGTDGALFSVEQGEATPNDSSGDGVLTAGVDEIRYMESFLTVRPLPAGQYEIDRKEAWAGFIPCNYLLTHKWPITVTAPAGALHESFFDPVTVGAAVEADGSNGQLSPASFDNSGVTTTLESLSYEAAAGSGEAGTVKLKLDPHDGLTGHALDIIELDGTVSLSLDASDAVVDSVNRTLSWTVSSQPWEDGDQLMLRIREARARAAR